MQVEERKEPEVETVVKQGFTKLQSDTLVCIDNHIKGCLNDSDFTLSNEFEAFANAHTTLSRDEIKHLQKNECARKNLQKSRRGRPE